MRDALVQIGAVSRRQQGTSLAERARKGEHVTVDALVVGSGAGGAAAARTLTRKGLKVLVLEEGRRFQQSEFTGKSPSWSLTNLYRDKGLQTFQGPVIAPLPAGRVVGGSTVVNSVICFRGPGKRIKEWRELSGATWLNDDVMTPLYDEVERTIAVVETNPAIARTNNLIFLRGAKALGLPNGFIRRNAPGCTGCGVCHLGCPSGGKWSVDKNFLAQAEDDGCSVLPSARVAKLRMDGKRCVGAEAELLDENGAVTGTATINAANVILSAGTIGTPLILLRNEIGTRSGHVGEHLSMHPGVSSLGLYDEDVRPWSGVPQGAWAEIPDEPDALMETFNVTLDIYYRFLAAPGVAGLERIKRANNIGSFGCMLKDRSVGRVALGDGWRANIQYAMHDEDRKLGIRAMKWLAKLQFAAGALEVLPGRKGFDFVKTEKEALAALDADFPTTEFMQMYGSHPMGTCRMNADPSQGVVDPEGRVNGTQGLYIMDASIFPSSLGVNPQMTVMALAMHLASGVAKA